MKLQYKIALMIFGFGAVFMVSVASVSYLYNRSQYIQRLHVNLLDTARERAAHVEINLRERAKHAVMLSNVPMIVEALTRSNSEFAAMTEDERQGEIRRLNDRWVKTADAFDPFIHAYTTNPVAGFLKEHMERNPGEYGEIFLTNRYGSIIATTEKLTTLAHPHKYWWIAAFAEGKGRVFFDDRGFDASVEGYVTGVVVPVMKDGEIIGILKCNVNITGVLLDTIEGLKLGETGNLKIVRSGGRIVLEKNKEPLSTEAPPVIVEGMRERGAGSIVIEDREEALFYAYAPISITSGSPEYGFGGSHESIDHIKGNRGELWYVFLSQDLDEALFPLHESLRVGIFVGLLTIVLMGLTSILFGRRLALPVMRMEGFARRVGEGDFDVQMDVRSRDDLGHLAESFNAMTRNLRETATSRDLLASEVAERRQAEEELARVNRALKAMSEFNYTLVHVTNESDLLDHLCRIIVELGGYRMAWVGFAEKDEEKSVNPVAQAGFEEGYLETVNITWADNERGRGPTGTAIRTGKPCIAKNVQTDPAFKPWQAEAIKRGYASSAAIPLSAVDRVFGVLNIYAAEPNAFEKEELGLLQQLAADSTYGIMTLRTRAERKLADEKLEKSENKYKELWQQFQTLLNAMPDSLLLLSPDREVIWSNREGPKNGGRRCYELWASSSQPCKECPTLKSFETDKAEESQIASSDGRIWDVRTFPIVDEEGDVTNVLELVSDITEKVKFQEEAMRTGHLTSLGELAAGVAHEINNPINGIINLAQLLVDENPPDDKDREIYDWIISEGMRIAAIVRGLLVFARKSGHEKMPVNISDVISDSLALTRAQMEKEDIFIKVDIPPDLPDIVANSGQLQQVFLNIINNARYAMNQKYMGWDKNKILEISVEKVTAKDNPYMRIIFHDTGAGIPGDLTEKIVDPFFSTKPEEDGTGLGLSISHGIVIDHGGRLTFDSVEGEFTKVLVDIPLTQNPESSTRKE